VDTHNVVENNTKALEKLPDIIHDKIIAALKK
jgi:hypothetical protein